MADLSSTNKIENPKDSGNQGEKDWNNDFNSPPVKRQPIIVVDPLRAPTNTAKGKDRKNPKPQRSGTSKNSSSSSSKLAEEKSQELPKTAAPRKNNSIKSENRESMPKLSRKDKAKAKSASLCGSQKSASSSQDCSVHESVSHPWDEELETESQADKSWKNRKWVIKTKNNNHAKSPPSNGVNSPPLPLPLTSHAEVLYLTEQMQGLSLNLPTTPPGSPPSSPPIPMELTEMKPPAPDSPKFVPLPVPAAKVEKKQSTFSFFKNDNKVAPIISEEKTKIIFPSFSSFKPLSFPNINPTPSPILTFPSFGILNEVKPGPFSLPSTLVKNESCKITPVSPLVPSGIIEIKSSVVTSTEPIPKPTPILEQPDFGGNVVKTSCALSFVPSETEKPELAAAASKETKIPIVQPVPKVIDSAPKLPTTINQKDFCGNVTKTFPIPSFAPSKTVQPELAAVASKETKTPIVQPALPKPTTTTNQKDFGGNVTKTFSIPSFAPSKTVQPELAAVASKETKTPIVQPASKAAPPVGAIANTSKSQSKAKNPPPTPLTRRERRKINMENKPTVVNPTSSVPSLVDTPNIQPINNQNNPSTTSPNPELVVLPPNSLPVSTNESKCSCIENPLKCLVKHEHSAADRLIYLCKLGWIVPSFVEPLISDNSVYILHQLSQLFQYSLIPNHKVQADVFYQWVCRACVLVDSDLSVLINSKMRSVVFNIARNSSYDDLNSLRNSTALIEFPQVPRSIISEIIATYKMPLSKTIPEIILKEFEAVNIRYILTDTGANLSHAHAKDHIARQYQETISILNLLFTYFNTPNPLFVVRFLDICASTRTKNTINYINSLSQGNFFIYYSAYCSNHANTDLDSKFDDADFIGDHFYQIIYMCDIYKINNYYLNSELLRNISDHASVTGWLGHVHIGAGGTQGLDGVWYRRGDDITVLCDDRGTTYTHRDVNWFVQEEERFWSVEVLTPSDYVFCKCTVDTMTFRLFDSIDLPPTQLVFWDCPIEFETTFIGITDFSQSLDPGIWESLYNQLIGNQSRRVTYHREIADEALRALAGQLPSTYQLNKIFKTINDPMFKNKVWMAIHQHDIPYANGIIAATTCFVFHQWISLMHAITITTSQCMSPVADILKWQVNPVTKPWMLSTRIPLFKWGGFAASLLLVKSLGAEDPIKYFKNSLKLLALPIVLFYGWDQCRKRKRLHDSICIMGERITSMAKECTRQLLNRISTFAHENVRELDLTREDHTRKVVYHYSKISYPTRSNYKPIDIEIEPSLPTLDLRTGQLIDWKLMSVGEESSTTLYKYTGFNFPLYRPNKSPEAINTMVSRIILRRLSTPAGQSQAFRKFSFKFPISLEAFVKREKTYEDTLEWVTKHVKSVLYGKTLSALMGCGFDTVRNKYVFKMFPKTDETLFSTKSSVRPIFNASPEFVVKMGAVVASVTKGLKFSMNGLNPINITTIPDSVQEKVYFFFAPGANYLKMGDWFGRAMITVGWHIAAAGDDSLVIHTTGINTCTIYEGDFSKYDTCQLYIPGGPGPLHVLLEFLRDNKIDQMVISLMEHMYTADVLVCDAKQVPLYRIANNGSLGLPTGCPQTTLSNTLLNLSLWTRWIIYRGSQIEFSDPAIFFKELGFGLKVLYPLPHSASFLKGKFVPTIKTTPEHQTLPDFIWTPSLCQLVKFGTCKRNPKTIRNYNKAKTIHEACRMHIADVSRSWLYYPLHPVFEAACKRAVSMVEIDKITPGYAKINDWQVGLPAEIIPQIPIDWSNYNEHYHMTTTDVSELLTAVSSLDIGIVIDHPAIVRWSDEYK